MMSDDDATNIHYFSDVKLNRSRLDENLR
jgi:hypothetical protein